MESLVNSILSEKRGNFLVPICVFLGVQYLILLFLFSFQVINSSYKVILLLFSSRLALIILSRRLKKKFGIQFGIGSFGFLVLKDIWIKRNEKVIVVSLLYIHRYDTIRYDTVRYDTIRYDTG